MDEVDQKQQDEIEALKRKDVAHDTLFSGLFNRVYALYFLTILALFIAGFIALPFLNMKMSPTINIQIDKDLITKVAGTEASK